MRLLNQTYYSGLVHAGSFGKENQELLCPYFQFMDSLEEIVEIEMNWMNHFIIVSVFFNLKSTVMCLLAFVDIFTWNANV